MPNQGSKNPRVYSGSIKGDIAIIFIAVLIAAAIKFTRIKDDGEDSNSK
jgi:hypothetical protein